MTLKELLVKAGITEDVADKVLEDMKSNKIFTSSEENADLRYSKLKTDHDAKLAELQKANELIQELQKSTKGNEDLQGKITEYENQVTELQAENQKIKLDSAIKVALLSEKAVDVDYLTFKLQEKGELALDENEKIKNWDDLLAGLKTKFPTQFEVANGEKKIEENKLPGSDGAKEVEPTSLADAIKMQYETKQ